MPDVDLDADDPFEILGVERSVPFHEIRQRVTELTNEYDTNDAIATISNAFEEIQSGPHIKQVGGIRNEPLIVEAETATAAVNESVRVTVTDITGTPVEDAELKVEGSREGFTDSNGEKILSFSSADSYEVTATKTHPDDDCEYRNGRKTIDVGRLQRSLVFAECPDLASFGEAVDLRVTDSNGSGQEDAWVGGPRFEAEVPTDKDGWAAVVPTETSPDAELVATKDDTSNLTYDDATTTIEITKRQIELSFDNPPSEVTYDEPTEFRVVDQNGTGVEGVEVTVPDETVRTDNWGDATVLFDRVGIGESTVRAVKDGADGEQVIPARTTVTVTPKHVEMNAWLVDTGVVVGEPAMFKVSDADGNGIQDAFVTSEGADSDTTTSSGHAHLIFNTATEETQTVRVSKTDSSGRYNYVPTKTKVSVDKHTKQLHFDMLPWSAEPNEQVHVAITTADGDPVEGVKIRPDDGVGGETDRRGRTYIEFHDTGRQQVSASKTPTKEATYQSTDDHLRVINQRQLEFTSLPSNPVVGEPMEVRVGDGDTDGVKDVTIEFGNGSRATTDADGRAQIEPSQVGKLKLTATKRADSHNKYESTSETVSVERQRQTLSFQRRPRTAPVSEPFTLKLTDESGAPVSGATIRVDNETKGQTNSSGCLTVSHDELGMYSIQASKRSTDEVNYVSASETVEIERPSPRDVLEQRDLFVALGGGGLVAASLLFMTLQTTQLAVGAPYSSAQAVLQAVFVGILPPIVLHNATREQYLAFPALLLGGGGTIGSMFVIGAIGLPVSIASTVVAIATALICTRLGEQYTVQLRTIAQVLGSLTVAFVMINAIMLVLLSGSSLIVVPALVFVVGFLTSLLVF
jgi:uncharacterized GH25 family protein